MVLRNEMGWDSYWGDRGDDWEAEPEFEWPGEAGGIFPWEDVEEAKANPVLQSN